MRPLPQVSSLGDTVWIPGDVIINSGVALDLVGSTTANALNFGQKNFKVAGSGIGGTGVITIRRQPSAERLAARDAHRECHVRWRRAFYFAIRPTTIPTPHNSTWQVSRLPKSAQPDFIGNPNVTPGDIVVNSGCSVSRDRPMFPRPSNPTMLRRTRLR